MTNIAATTFQQAAQRQDPAVFDYAREVQQVWRDFPETKEVIYFLDICAAPGQSLIYPGDQQRKETLQRWVENKESLLSSMHSFMYKRGSCYKRVEEKGFLLLFTRKKMFNHLAEIAGLAQETTLAFDHELGHAIIPDGSGPGDVNLKESIADAYAMIRHFQRYGADSDVIDAVPVYRAFNFFQEKGTPKEHFTSSVTEQILARRYEIDWDSLTPEETKQLARQFALQYAMHPRRLEVLGNFFEGFYGKIAELCDGDLTPFRELADKVFATSVSEAFKWGAAILNLALEGHLRKEYDIVLTGDAWDNIRQKLAERQQAFESQDAALFGLGGKDRPLQRKRTSNVVNFPGRKNT